MTQTALQKINPLTYSKLKPGKGIDKISFSQKWEPVVTKITTDENYAYKFFFSTDLEFNADQLMSLLTAKLCKTYGLEIDKSFVSTIVFTGLWDEGRWSRIKKYAYKVDFFSWLTTVSSQIIYDRLEDEGYIHRCVKNSSKYRLRLMSKPENVRNDVVNLVNIPDLSKFLRAYYVEKRKDREIKEKLNLSDEMYVVTKRVAEKCLIEILLNTEDGQYYAHDVLSEKAPINPIANSVQIESIGDTIIDDNPKSNLIDVFDFEGKGVNLESNVVKFLERFVTCTLKWKKSDVELWQQRFIHNEPAEDIAIRIGRTRAYVDDRFCKLSRRFEKAIRKWWRINVECRKAV